MSKTLRATTALSAVIAASLVAGCAGPANRFKVSGGFASKADTRNIGVATRAQLALEAGDYASAITYAERAVENTPNDAGFRSLLGNAYLAAGRFASAQAAFRDSLALMPGQAGVAMKLVLAEIASGRNGEALALLDELRPVADPADVGLAMALAGQPGNAIALLDEAARRPEADARTRQNLALAHAMAGDWQNARVVAAQDVPADQLDARIAEWMRTASPQNSGTQVAALIGVAPAAADPGQPVRLALRASEQRMAAVSTPVQPVADAAALPIPVAQVAATDTTVMSDPGFAAPTAPEPASASDPASAVTLSLPERPLVAAAAPMADLAESLDALRRERVRSTNRLPRVAELRRSAAARFAHSGVVVQVGAYGSRRSLEAGWNKLSRQHSAMSRYVPATSRFQAKSGPVYRLSLKGFASATEARGLCGQLKSAGAACFVRNAAGDSSVRFASR